VYSCLQAATSDQHVVGTPIEDLGSAKIGPAPVLLLIGRAIQLPKATKIFDASGRDLLHAGRASHRLVVRLLRSK
jgi:hypothetical protein